MFVYKYWQFLPKDIKECEALLVEPMPANIRDGLTRELATLKGLRAALNRPSIFNQLTVVPGRRAGGE